MKRNNKPIFLFIFYFLLNTPAVQDCVTKNIRRTNWLPNIFHQNRCRLAAHLNGEIRLTIGNFAVFQSKLSAKASDYEQCMKSI